MQSDYGVFQPEDIYNLKLPVSPRFSPDGKQAAFVMQSWDREKDSVVTNIYLFNIETGEYRQLTDGCCDTHPRFSPEGSKLAFVSHRSGQYNVWIIDLQSRETWQIKFEGRVISPPVWSSDGKKIAFTAFSGVNCCQDSDDITVVRKFYHKYDSYGFFRGSYSQIHTAKVVPDYDKQNLTTITSGEYNHFNPAWSPEGDKISYTIMREDYLEKGVYKHDICYYDLENGYCRTIVKGKGPVKSLKWSPGEKFMAFIGHQNQYGRATTDGIWLVPLVGDFPLRAGTTFNLTSELERPAGTAVDSDLSYCCQQISSLKWSEDGKKIYFLAADRGSSYIFAVTIPSDISRNYSGDIPGKTDIIAFEGVSVDVQAAEPGQNIRYFDYHSDSFIYTASSPEQPDELFFHQGDNSQQISYFNQNLQQRVKFYPAQKFSYRGAEDWEIEGWVLNKSKDNPLAVVIHGGPHLAYGDSFMFQSQVLAAAGYTVFYANPRGSQSYGQSFASAVVQDWGRNDFQDIMNGIDYVIEKGWADEEKIAIMGWSYGGYLTCWAVSHSNKFRAAVAGGSVTNLYSFYGTSDIGYSFGEFEIGGTSCHSKERLIYRSPINYVSQIETPLLILHGEEDLRCPISQSEELFTALIRCNKETLFVRYPDESHILKKPSHIVDRWYRTLDWFDKYLG